MLRCADGQRGRLLCLVAMAGDGATVSEAGRRPSTQASGVGFYKRRQSFLGGQDCDLVCIVKDDASGRPCRHRDDGRTRVSGEDKGEGGNRGRRDVLGDRRGKGGRRQVEPAAT